MFLSSLFLCAPLRAVADRLDWLIIVAVGGGDRPRGSDGAGGRASPPRYDEPPLDASTEWRGAPTYRVPDERRGWAKPGMARLVLERLGEVVASGRRSLYGTVIDSPAALFAAMGGGTSAVGMAQFRRALRRLDVAASEEAIVATIEMLDPQRCYFRAFDGREFVRILTPFCVIRPPPDPPPLLQSIQNAAERPPERPVWREDTARPSRRRGTSPGRRQKPVWTWFADGQKSMSSQFIDRSEVLHEPLSSRLKAVRRTSRALSATRSLSVYSQAGLFRAGWICGAQGCCLCRDGRGAHEHPRRRCARAL